MSPRPIIVRGGRLLDPSQGLDRLSDLLLLDGKVAAVLAPGATAPPEAEAMDARGLIVAPGFIDLHVHLREPGYEQKETIATGTLAAVQGGFTTVLAMANTKPVADSEAVIAWVRDRAEAGAACRVLPVGSVTVGQQGKELAPLAELAEAGAVAFSDDGQPISDPNLLRAALDHARALQRPILAHCEDTDLVGEGVMNEGPVATHLGLPGIPDAAEDSAVAEAIALAAFTAGPLHLCHLSTRGSLALLRIAKEQGLPVTAEVTPHHLLLTDERVLGPAGAGSLARYDTHAKMRPPLRSEADRQALVAALREGLIDAIATDHAPHAPEDKECEFAVAANGVVGLETAFGVLMRLVHEGALDLPTLIERLTAGPARVIARSGGMVPSDLASGLGTLQLGAPADVVLLDPEAEWTVDPATFVSKGRNTPFAGWRLRGRVMTTIVGGETAFTIKR